MEIVRWTRWTLAAAVLALAPGAAAEAQVCRENAQCAETEFCAKRTGRCEGRGRCTVRPEVCPQVFDPVCGCDGQTYSNSCFAAMAGVSVAARGECAAQACTANNQCAQGFFCLRPGGDCNAAGTCAVRPEACPLVFDPVCGCDGRTYSNSCFAAMAGVSVASLGACPEERCRDNADCGADSFCLRPGDSCRGRGRCEPRPEACIEVFDPVCGCDGQIYANSCFAAQAGVSVANEGETCRRGGLSR